MVFELTDELVDSIISALENQEQQFAVDASSGRLVEIKDIECDEDSFYMIPTWSSADGFNLMEQFVNSLHSPMARNDLLTVLRSGRGVFRGFKDVLKSYPEVEKKWHYFKNKQLINYVNQWYNSLRETWGLEKLDCEIEETEDLLRDDFTFLPYDYSCDSEEIFEGLDLVAKEYSAEYHLDVLDEGVMAVIVAVQSHLVRVYNLVIIPHRHLLITHVVNVFLSNTVITQ